MKHQFASGLNGAETNHADHADHAHHAAYATRADHAAQADQAKPDGVQATRESAPCPTAATAAPALRSDELFAGKAEIEIHHGPLIYRLRKTSLGKLILTK